MSVEVADGEIISVIGPDGSGKSTFLKCLNGADSAGSGTVELDGVDCTRLPMHRHVSIRDSLSDGRHLMSRRGRDERLAELFDQTPTLRRRPGARADSFKGGKRQLLAVCRAMMPRSKTLMLDEPSAELAQVKVSERFDTIASVRRRKGVGALLIGQYATDSLSSSGRAVILVHSRVAMTDHAASMQPNSEVSELYLGGILTDRAGAPASTEGST